jgi:hypothetical protein
VAATSASSQNYSTDPALVAQQVQWWFRGGADVEIIDRLQPVLAAAEHGDFDDWSSSPKSRLALRIVLDQFSRSIHRGSARAYSADGEKSQGEWNGESTADLHCLSQVARDAASTMTVPNQQARLTSLSSKVLLDRIKSKLAMQALQYVRTSPPCGESSDQPDATLKNTRERERLVWLWSGVGLPTERHTPGYGPVDRPITGPSTDPICRSMLPEASTLSARATSGSETP